MTARKWISVLPLPGAGQPWLLSPSRLAEIEDRAQAAGPVPWKRRGRHVPADVVDEEGYYVGEIATGPAAEFIAHARQDVPDMAKEIRRLSAALRAATDQIAELEDDLGEATARIATLEKAAVEARAALGSLCYDHEDPGTAALGALYLLTQATLWTEDGADFGAEALAQHASEVLHRVANMADPEPPEASFFGDYGPQVAAWLRRRASQKASVLVPTAEEAS
ncbi:hypothetical protein TU94_28155 [Streptomyces cyaneogriseus subsp. noncyanogenus]|uniref:Uncharacterized protein n=1 Tax=Streptomyces cyaneogriseus subsp. noncyanogenus TaxID=477245 RepID=A0A0C5G7L6_9ACTN|nr:hypothetical protein [Streptomyces cyaneogriseus]AJP04745.1 hypothetical protein TU94_28155 [Streptomyces cyaneogriseus subsp. noncyanogenus]